MYLKKPNSRKRISMILAVVCCMALLVSSFAYFTDRYNTSATATAGTIDLVFTDVSDAAAHKVASQQNTDNQIWTDGKITNDTEPIMNPGDAFDMGYKLTNTGSKSIDVKQKLVLTSSVAMNKDAAEYQLKCGTDGATLTPSISEDGKVITYTLPDVILNGTVETETSGVAQDAGQDYDLYLEFDVDAKNAFMNSNVTVELDIQAKQHRNTTADDWADWATYKTAVEQIPNA